MLDLPCSKTRKLSPFLFWCVCESLCVCTCVSSSLFYLNYHSQLLLFFSSLLSLPHKPISAVPQLPCGIIASLLATILSCLIRLHKDFKLAKNVCMLGALCRHVVLRGQPTTRCWCCWRLRKKIREGRGLPYNSFTPGRFHAAEKGEVRRCLFTCCLAGPPIGLAPGSHGEMLVLLGLGL